MSERAPGGWSLTRALFRLILVAIIGTALAFAAAPFFAFRAVKAAARDGDGQALAQLVDYPAVRQGLRPQVTAKPVSAPAPPDFWTDPVGAVRRAIEPLTPPPPAVEPYLDAAGLYDLTRGYAPGKRPADAKARMVRLRFWGPNRARFAAMPATAKSPDQAVIFSFERRDLFTWKLVQIHLPPEPAAR